MRETAERAGQRETNDAREQKQKQRDTTSEAERHNRAKQRDTTERSRETREEAVQAHAVPASRHLLTRFPGVGGWVRRKRKRDAYAHLKQDGNGGHTDTHTHICIDDNMRA